METKEMKCQAGCIAFSGMEIKHHHDCVHYPGSMSKIYDRLKERNTSQKETVDRFREFVNWAINQDDYGSISGRAQFMGKAKQLLKETEQ